MTQYQSDERWVRRINLLVSVRCSVKLAFHDADTDTDFFARFLAGMSAMNDECN